jgi:NitT/TauT family transport system substrate-binding protein
VVAKVNVVPEVVLRQRMQEVEAVLRALVKISRDFAADPRKWVDAMAVARPDVGRSDLETLAGSFAGSWSVNGGLDRNELEFTMDWLYATPDFQDLPRIAVTDWVDFSPLDSVLAGAGIAAGPDSPGR